MKESPLGHGNPADIHPVPQAAGAGADAVILRDSLPFCNKPPTGNPTGAIPDVFQATAGVCRRFSFFLLTSLTIVR